MAAVAESRANAEYAGIPYPFRTPRLLVAIDLDLARTINLTNPGTLDRMTFLLEEASREDWRKEQDRGQESVTQAFGRACFDQSVNGLLVPSARVAGSVNVVYLPGNRVSTREAVVCEAEKLDRIRYDE